MFEEHKQKIIHFFDALYFDAFNDIYCIFLGVLHPQIPATSVTWQGAFLEKLKAIDGISIVETQTYTLEEAAPHAPKVIFNT